MAWPITLNGNTYTEAEIVGPDYDQVLGRFLYDLSRQISLTKTPVAESSSTIVPGTGNRNFALSKGSYLAFPVGGMVTSVGYTVNGKPKYLLTGEVIPSVGGGNLLRVRVDHQFQFPDSETTSVVRWELVSGTWVVTPEPEPSIMEPAPDAELRIIEDFEVPYSYGTQKASATSPDPFPVGIYSTGNYVLRPSQDLRVNGRPGVVRLSPGEAGAAALMMDRVDVHYAVKGTVTFGFRVVGTGSGHLSAGLRGRVPATDDGTPANLLQPIGPPHGPALRTRISPGGAGSERTESVFALQYLGTEPGVHLFSAGDWLTLEFNTDGFPEEFVYGVLTNHSSGVSTLLNFGGSWPAGMAPYLVPYLTLWRNTGGPLHLDVDYIEVRQDRTLGSGSGGGGGQVGS